MKTIISPQRFPRIVADMQRASWPTWIIPALFLGGLFSLTHWPQFPTPTVGAGVGADKWFHFGAYGILTMLAMRTFLSQPDSVHWSIGKLIRVSLVVGLSVIVVASIDELTQPWVGRSCDLADWFADCVGVSLSVLAAASVHWARRVFTDVNPEYAAS
jgi:VanZ family protein